MRTLRPLLGAALAATAACSSGGPGPYNETPSLGAPKAFSATVGTPPASTTTYGDRLGPTNSPWSDSVSDVVIPPQPGALQSPKVASKVGGPEVLVGSLAVSVGQLGTGSEVVTVATDLDTGAEKWRLAAAQSFDPGLVTTNGTQVCGLHGSSTASATLQCLTLATGAVAWTKPLGRMVALIPGYGWPTELVVHGDAVFVLGLGKLDVFALADGSPRYSLAQSHVGRGLVFLGDDLLLSGATSTCASGSSCLRAVNPTTGATVAESPTPASAFLWSEGTKAYYLATSASGRAIVTYDATTHTFGDDAALLTALTNLIGINSRQTLFGLTPVLANGKVYLGGGDAGAGDDPTVGGKLCRFNTKTRTADPLCVEGIARPSAFRVYPNYVTQGGNTLQPDNGASNVTTAAIYFGKWAFVGGEVHALR